MSFFETYNTFDIGSVILYNFIWIFLHQKAHLVLLANEGLFIFLWPTSQSIYRPPPLKPHLNATFHNPLWSSPQTPPAPSLFCYHHIFEDHFRCIRRSRPFPRRIPQEWVSHGDLLRWKRAVGGMWEDYRRWRGLFLMLMELYGEF